MTHRPRVFSKGIFCGLLVIIICLSSFIVTGAQGNQDELSQQTSEIRIIQEEIPYFNGINSIRAIIGNSSIGILYPKTGYPQNLYVFTTFSQKIATIEIYNRRGVLSYRNDLVVENSFLMSLVGITEFEDKNNNSLMDLLEPIHSHTIDFKDVNFSVRRQTETSVASEANVSYKVYFEASDIAYRGGLDKLENLSFFFEFELQKDRVKMPNIPTVSIYQRGSQLDIVKSINLENLDAISLSPRLKFSCNISGWDYQFPNSKLLLKVETLASEQLKVKTERIPTGISLTRDTLKSTGLLGSLTFHTNQNGKMSLDHNDITSNSYNNQYFTNTQFTIGNSLREFLNFSWSQTVNVDGVIKPVLFQPLFSGSRNILKHNENTPFIFLTGGFIFSQGSEIYYDPEIRVMELNPIFELLQVPIRSIIQENSLLILISGFFVGVLIIVRSRSTKIKAKEN